MTKLSAQRGHGSSGPATIDMVKVAAVSDSAGPGSLTRLLMSALAGLAAVSSLLATRRRIVR